MDRDSKYYISSLEIENFRQYRAAKIVFSRGPTKTFTIIRGENGAGKTNIMNAITWCLYGTEKHFGSDEEDLPIVNTRALKEKPDGLVNMHVSLTLADGTGDKYKITRKMSLYNSGDTSNVTYDKDTGTRIPLTSTPSITKTFQIYYPDRGGWETTDYFNKEVYRLLPEDLAAYFLFDGEKLEDFFEQADNTRKGIEDVSQIKTAEKAICTLEKIIRKMRHSTRDAPNLKDLLSRLEKAEESKIGSEEKIGEINTNMQKNQRRIREIERAIIQYGGDVGELQDRINRIRAEIETIQGRLDYAESGKREYVLKHLFEILILPHIKKTLEMIKEKTNEGILPPKIQETFLRELLENRLCICGNDISEGLSSRREVENLLRKAKYSQISGLCTELKFKLEPMQRTDDVIDELNKYDKTINEYRTQREQKKSERDELAARIDSTNIESIQKLQSEKNILESEDTELNQKLGYNKRILEDEKRTYQSLETEYNKALSQDARHKHVMRQMEFCNKALVELDRIRSELLDEVRNTVQRYTKEYFLQFLWKKDTYDDVTIDDQYNITARHIDGYEVRTGLSKGEKLVLALAFMSALRKITGFGFPLLIDTPLGRVSGEPRHNIACLLPDFLKNNQVTLLVTDTEYQSSITDDDGNQMWPPIRDTIATHVGADYDIVFENGKSEVAEH